MEFTISKNILLENLNIVGKALSSKNLIPILGGIKFDLTKEGLYLTATDNDIIIQTFIKKNIDKNFKIKTEGSLVINGRYILEIIRKLSDEIININVLDGLKVLIYTKKSKFNLNAFNKDDYPTINITHSNKKIKLSKTTLKEIINRTSFATSTEETRPLLTGVNFSYSNKKLACTATDSYRLSKIIFDLEEVKEEFNFVIPSRNLIELNKIIMGEVEEIEINIFSNKILFIFDNILFQTKILNGSYPNTSNLIPNDYLLKIHVDGENLYNVIDRVSLLTNDREKNIVSLKILKDQMLITSNHPEIGKVEEIIDIDIEKNKEVDFKISFSGRYVLDLLKTITGKKIEILFCGELSAIIFKDLEYLNVIYLVLPIRTY
ncbi:MAG: DNA polymerase III subunit beta [Bacilli bacterium]